MDLNAIRGFIHVSKTATPSKDEIREKLEEVELELQTVSSEHNDELTMIEKIESCNAQNTKKKFIEKYGTTEEIRKKCSNLELYQKELNEVYSDLEAIMNVLKNFNKAVCFSNIRELLRQKPDVKIGQIEKEAGIRLGYMSRLEKEGNTSEPSMEFIVTAAKLLNVSIDTLVSVDITALTPTEQYLVNFFDKLKSDTLIDKFNWNTETKFELDRLEQDMNGYVQHPLFSEETFYEQSDCEYPEEVTRVVYSSKTFGPATCITGDCFNLRLKNGSTLYLMNLEKSVHSMTDNFAFVKEAVMYIPQGKTQVLATTQDENQIAQLLEMLYSTVQERMKHPQVNNDVMYAIDAFMKDDISDDEEELPF